MSERQRSRSTFQYPSFSALPSVGPEESRVWTPDPKQHEEESQVTQPALAVGVALRRGLPGHLEGDLRARPLRRARDIDTAIAHGVSSLGDVERSSTTQWRSPLLTSPSAASSTTPKDRSVRIVTVTQEKTNEYDHAILKWHRARPLRNPSVSTTRHDGSSGILVLRSR